MKRTLGLLFSFLISISVLAPVSSASAADSNECTIFGTNKADRIIGTSGNDIICAAAGNDLVRGLGGDDIIYGGSGNDRIFGGAGNDEINSETGKDYVDGGAGLDEISGGKGNDSLFGGSDSDLILGELGKDDISGGNGSDTIDGGKDSDTIRSGSGSDMCGKDSKDVLLDPCTLDIKGPEFGPLTAEVRQFSAGSLAVFTVTATDESGVAGIYGSIGGAPGWVTEWCGFLISGLLTEGSAKSGTYTLKCTIPSNAVNDDYTLQFRATDLMGNYNGGESIAFQVIGGSADNQSPTVTNIDLPKEVVAGEKFTITVSATDESEVAVVYSWFALEGGWVTGGGPLYASGSEPRLVTESLTEAVVEQDVVFDDKAPAGKYRVWLSVRDGVGNRNFYETSSSITLKK